MPGSWLTPGWNHDLAVDWVGTYNCHRVVMDGASMNGDFVHYLHHGLAVLRHSLGSELPGPRGAPGPRRLRLLPLLPLECALLPALAQRGKAL